MEHNRPKVGIGVFVLKDDTFLIGLRRGAHGEGTWSLPGGHLEYGESWEDCARREVLEETGLSVGDIQFLTATNDIFESEEKHYVTIFMMAKHISGEPERLEPEKCLEWKWCTWDTMPEQLFLPLLNLKKQGFHLDTV